MKLTDRLWNAVGLGDPDQEERVQTYLDNGAYRPGARLDAKAGPRGSADEPGAGQENQDMRAAAALATIVRQVVVSKDGVGGGPIKRGRISVDNADQAFGGNFNFITEPKNYEDSWHTIQLDANTLSKVNAHTLLQVMCDISPEISRGAWDFLRLCNPGWEYSAKLPGQKTENKQARALIDSFIGKLNLLYGSADVVFGKLFLAAFIRGALCGEIVLGPDAREPIDLVTPDPITIRFKQMKDEVRGNWWQQGQWVGGQWVPLNIPTVMYVPIDPFPGSPYGRPIAAPALFSGLFMLALLHDLRRVVAQQGYPRLDIEVDLEALTAVMPPDVSADEEKSKLWVDSIIQSIVTAYSALNPEDAYVHTSVVKVNRPVGAVDTQSLGAIDGLFKSLERTVVRALKTMPLMMGSTEGMSEANANRQWEIVAAGIKSIQHYGEAVVGRLFEIACQAGGIQAVIEFRFAELRTAELLRDAQVQQLVILNARDMYEAGAISLDEMAEMMIGHDADHEPITYVGQVAKTSPNGGQSPNPEPGQNKAAPGTPRLNGHAAVNLDRLRERVFVNGRIPARSDILRWRRQEFRDDDV